MNEEINNELKETLKAALLEYKQEEITQSEAFDEFISALIRLKRLGEKVVQMGKTLESGQEINARTLKKLGGSIKWWERRAFLWANYYITLSRR